MTSKSRVAIPMPLIIFYGWGDYAIAGDIYKYKVFIQSYGI